MTRTKKVEGMTKDLKRRARIAFNLHLARHMIRMTQRDAAEAAGISDSHLSQIERGKADAGDNVLSSLARAYGVFVRDLKDRRATIVWEDA